VQYVQQHQHQQQVLHQVQSRPSPLPLAVSFVSVLSDCRSPGNNSQAGGQVSAVGSAALASSLQSPSQAVAGVTSALGGYDGGAGGQYISPASSAAPGAALSLSAVLSGAPVNSTLSPRSVIGPAPTAPAPIIVHTHTSAPAVNAAVSAAFRGLQPQQSLSPSQGAAFAPTGGLARTAGAPLSPVWQGAWSSPKSPASTGAVATATVAALAAAGAGGSSSSLLAATTVAGSLSSQGQSALVLSTSLSAISLGSVGPGPVAPMTSPAAVQRGSQSLSPGAIRAHACAEGSSAHGHLMPTVEHDG
jgi:hypothetical protein